MRQRMLAEQVQAVYATIGSATLADIALALVVALVFYFSGSAGGLVLLWLLLHAMQDARYPLLGAYVREDPGADQRFWARRYAAELGINSAVWGIAPWLLLPGLGLPMVSVLMTVIMGLATAGVASVAPLRQAVYTYCSPMMAGLAAFMLWQATQGHGMVYLFLGLCCLLYMVILWRFALQQHRLLRNALQARFENEALAAQLAQQVQAVQRVSEEKSRFFAAASHDLRQPVHALWLLGAALERELQHHPQHGNAQRVMKAVQALSGSMDAMLDLSLLDAGILRGHVAAMPLQPLLVRLAETFQTRALEQGLELRVRSSPLWVHSDPELLQRMLANLVDNALKYTPRGGVLVAARARGGAVWLDVVDTGVGIAAAERPRIFQEFYQIDNPGRDRSRGLGMGLSIVQRLALLLQHSLVLHSRPGRGSRFRVGLARAQTASAAGQPGPANAHMPDPVDRLALPRRVLLLDDELEIHHAFAALLQGSGVDLACAADAAGAEQALQEAARQQQPFDVLVCDYRLARGTDGLRVGRRLQEQHAVALVMVTGELAQEGLRQIHETGVAVLFKPVQPQALLRALAEACAASDAHVAEG